MFIPLSSEKFLELRANTCIIDVRAPKEFEQGHIPGAYSVPLFSDAERAIVGTSYKHEGRETAIKKGFEIITPHVAEYIDQVKKLTTNKTVIVYCWRGGMRSKSIAMLLNFFGFTVYQLTGGYKAFKNFLYENAQKPHQITLLGGKTGSSKTALLQELHAQGEQTLDLEGFANHKGSVFGAIGEQPQPTQEQFTVDILLALTHIDPKKNLWIEKESAKIGNLYIPRQLWDQMQQAPVVYIEIPTQRRIENILHDYQACTPDEIIACIKQIAQHLGSQHTKELIDLAQQNDKREIVARLLVYYDKRYQYSLNREKRTSVQYLNFTNESLADQARKAIAACTSTSDS